VVDGEGEWTVEENGAVTFTPEEGFITSPTPMFYTAKITIETKANIIAQDGAEYITHYGPTDITSQLNGQGEGDVTYVILGAEGNPIPDGKPYKTKYGTVEIIRDASTGKQTV